MATVEKERPEDPQLTGIVGQAEEGRAPDTCARGGCGWGRRMKLFPQGSSGQKESQKTCWRWWGFRSLQTVKLVINHKIIFKDFLSTKKKIEGRCYLKTPPVLLLGGGRWEIIQLKSRCVSASCLESWLHRCTHVSKFTELKIYTYVDFISKTKHNGVQKRIRLIKAHSTNPRWNRTI